MSQNERARLSHAVVDAMKAAYEADGEQGDFDDARRHYLRDASEEELMYDHNKWCNIH